MDLDLHRPRSGGGPVRPQQPVVRVPRRRVVEARLRREMALQQPVLPGHRRERRPRRRPPTAVRAAVHRQVVAVVVPLGVRVEVHAAAAAATAAAVTRGERPPHRPRAAVDGPAVHVERLLVGERVVRRRRVPAQPAVEVEPRHAELAPGEVVDEEVGRRVEAHEEVGDPDDPRRDRIELALARDPGLRRAPDELVEVGDDLEALADDEEGAHGDQDDAEVVLLLLLAEEGAAGERGRLLADRASGGAVGCGAASVTAGRVADAGEHGAAEGGGRWGGAEEAGAGLDAAAEARVG